MNSGLRAAFALVSLALGSGACAGGCDDPAGSGGAPPESMLPSDPIARAIALRVPIAQ